MTLNSFSSYQFFHKPIKEHHYTLETPNGHISFLFSCNTETHLANKVILLSKKYFNKFFTEQVFDDPMFAIKESIIFVNKQLYFQLLHNELFSNIKLSYAIFIFRDNKIYFAKVGGIEIFHVRNNKWKHLTNHGRENLSEINFNQDPSYGNGNEIKLLISTTPIILAKKDIIITCNNSLAKSLSNESLKGIDLYNTNINIGESIIQNAISQGITSELLISYIYFKKIRRTYNNESFFDNIFSSQIISKLFYSKYSLAALIILIIISVLILILTQQDKAKDNIQRLDYSNLIITKNPNDVKTKNNVVDTTSLINNQVSEPMQNEWETPTDTIYIYTVKPGDNLFRISKRFNCRMAIISELNNFSSEAINVDQQISIKVTDICQIQNSDNISQLSKKYNVPEIRIREANNIEGNTKIIPGQDLIIPLK